MLCDQNVQNKESHDLHIQSLVIQFLGLVLQCCTTFLGPHRLVTPEAGGTGIDQKIQTRGNFSTFMTV